ncbi:hypothetical protein M011DRAFT_161786 [Sporormia fimetaria CBS 119925]|uniref:DUF3253 domain-containing protein n=1 Tax=Sporormia fimetaria CBS 119925 TaxID=1340428 RepID=A0A6A6V6P6_9PLEO|nr:hypothetical protein M011DRAFT_161786 [Sporormia fimetaria CBS 119925]
MAANDSKNDIIARPLWRLLDSRDWPKTICPSEVARALSSSDLTRLDAGTWRDAMDDVRRLVWDLKEKGDVEVLQKGEVLGDEVGLEDIHGPIRVRAKKKEVKQD